MRESTGIVSARTQVVHIDGNIRHSVSLSVYLLSSSLPVTPRGITRDKILQSALLSERGLNHIQERRLLVVIQLVNELGIVLRVIITSDYRNFKQTATQQEQAGQQQYRRFEKHLSISLVLTTNE